MVVAAGFLILQVWAAPSVSPANDTYRYAQLALRVLGESKQAAQVNALRAYCEDNAAWLARRQQVDPGSFAAAYRRDEAVSRCVRDSPHGLHPTSPRYDAIFDSRIGLPILAAPLVSVIGVNQALKATSVLLSALGGTIAYLILRILGLRRPPSLLGQGIYYTGPIGWWGSFGLTDGPTVTTSMATLLGAILLLRHRYRLGTTLVIISIGAGCFIRHSNFIFITGAVLAAAGAALRTDPRHRRPLLIIAALSAVGLVGLVATAHALHWSGPSDTLQDTFTHHFTRPDVTNPWQRLAGLNLQYWSQWTQEQVRDPWPVAAAAIGSVTLVRRHRTFGPIAVAAVLGLPLLAYPRLNTPTEQPPDRLVPPARTGSQRRAAEDTAQAIDSGAGPQPRRLERRPRHRCHRPT